MKLEVKPALIIIGTLLIGMVLGALSLSVIMRYRMERIHGMMRPGKFPHRILEVIGPLPDPQRSEAERIINRAFVRIDSTIQESRGQIDSLVGAMILELTPLLNADQLERLRREAVPRMPGREGPPFGGPPPGEPEGHRPPKPGEPRPW